jgi:hypothetical protein
VTLNNLFTNRQPNASTRKLGTAMETFENVKNPRKILGFNANSVITHTKEPFLISQLCVNVYLGWLIMAELNRVANQILE